MEKKASHREKVTAIVPCYNEEHNIRKVLESVSFADEIMVVDSFSTDKTIEIAKEYTDFIIQREYEYSASQKNWAIPQANHEWIILVDADECVTPELKDEILKTLENPGVDNITGYWIKRMNHFMGERINYSGWRNDKVIRLFHRDRCSYQDKQVHAEIKTDGKIAFLKNKFYHNTYTTLDAYYTKMNRYAAWQANDYDKKTGKLTPYHFVIKPFWGFFKHYIIQSGFRDGLPGLVIGYIQGYTVFMRYVKLWLLRRDRK
ncbi:glycosyltransferase family 2 protein [Aquimarina algiphila]|uniref:Glycosyltransferase family 2 protein n=1 Tax=Aquimarina algiphila TaxID=2047982 RepID=A0A554VQR6_9FLAO|nr:MULTISPECIES: glycosyltransferase family 2 protein [Aquimarina]TSE10966.1 glycosyltransferase family 2 protein [Aquimarina algiphila]